MSMIIEEWRPITGLEGSYEVSNQGRVRSIDRVLMQPSRSGNMVPKAYRGKLLAIVVNGPAGYRVVNLPDKNAEHYQKVQFVSTLVLEAFVGERPHPRARAKYLDGNPSNCTLDNLQWGIGPIPNPRQMREISRIKSLFEGSSQHG